MSKAGKPGTPSLDEEQQVLERIRKQIDAGGFKQVAANLSEGEGVTVTFRGRVRIDFIKKNGKLTARLSDGEPPKIFVG